MSLINPNTDKDIREIYENMIKYIYERTKIAEFQLNKIMNDYDKLSTGKMSWEESKLFANYLINLYNIVKNKSEKLGDENDSYAPHLIIIKPYVDLMKSDNISDIVIGIDNFISYSHMNSEFLADLILTKNGLWYELENFQINISNELSKIDKYYFLDDDYDHSNIQVIHFISEYFENLRNKFGNITTEKLDYIKNRPIIINRS